MYQIVNVGAKRGSEAFLIITDEKTALLDSGYAFCAKEMIGNIKATLKGRALDFCILSHSHYDHVSGSPYLKDEWPDIKIIAGEYVKKVFSKASAIEVMRDLNNNAALVYNVSGYDDKLDNLTVDITVKDGDIIDLGSLKFTVIETPGHTKCSLSFYDTEKELLLASETFGVPAGNNIIMPCCMVGYKMTMDSINKARRLGPKVILYPHLGFVPELNDGFFDNSISCLESLKKIVLKGQSQGKTEEEIKNDIKDAFYTPEICGFQPEKAFLLNAGYQIALILKEAFA
ncbi:MAG: MBL fold metallo-hydrolase [Bacillota bacterium]|nr:MBL fold metallo-hydrolase [Bacillota bacterium]